MVLQPLYLKLFLTFLFFLVYTLCFFYLYQWHGWNISQPNNNSCHFIALQTTAYPCIKLFTTQKFCHASENNHYRGSSTAWSVMEGLATYLIFFGPWTSGIKAFCFRLWYSINPCYGLCHPMHVMIIVEHIVVSGDQQRS